MPIKKFYAQSFFFTSADVYGRMDVKVKRFQCGCLWPREAFPVLAW
jgi:hypothetical protein